MNWIIGSCVVFLVCGLAMLFVTSARIIRRDVNERFRDIAARLEKGSERRSPRFVRRTQTGVKRSIYFKRAISGSSFPPR